MQVTITEKKENVLLNRMEIKGKIVFEGATTSNAQLTETLAKELKREADLIVIKNIYTRFSHQEADFFAYSYPTKEAKAKIEPKVKAKKATEAKKEGEK